MEEEVDEPAPARSAILQLDGRWKSVIDNSYSWCDLRYVRAGYWRNRQGLPLVVAEMTPPHRHDGSSAPKLRGIRLGWYGGVRTEQHVSVGACFFMSVHVELAADCFWASPARGNKPFAHLRPAGKQKGHPRGRPFRCSGILAAVRALLGGLRGRAGGCTNQWPLPVGAFGLRLG